MEEGSAACPSEPLAMMLKPEGGAGDNPTGKECKVCRVDLTEQVYVCMSLCWDKFGAVLSLWAANHALDIMQAPGPCHDRLPKAGTEENLLWPWAVSFIYSRCRPEGWGMGVLPGSSGQSQEPRDCEEADKRLFPWPKPVTVHLPLVEQSRKANLSLRSVLSHAG